jgi:putative transposase
VTYSFAVLGYVVMPEHVHLLLGEPADVLLSLAVRSIKQGVARRLALRKAESFWEDRYYDFNVWSTAKQIEKLRYIHRNPVRRGLVEKPEDWMWSSFRNYATGLEGIVEVESRWTEWKRNRDGTRMSVQNGPIQTFGDPTPP